MNEGFVILSESVRPSRHLYHLCLNGGMSKRDARDMAIEPVEPPIPPEVPCTQPEPVESMECGYCGVEHEGGIDDECPAWLRHHEAHENAHWDNL